MRFVIEPNEQKAPYIEHEPMQADPSRGTTPDRLRQAKNPVASPVPTRRDSEVSMWVNKSVDEGGVLIVRRDKSTGRPYAVGPGDLIPEDLDPYVFNSLMENHQIVPNYT